MEEEILGGIITEEEDKEYNLSLSNNEENLYSSYNSIFDKEKKKGNKSEQNNKSNNS